MLAGAVLRVASEDSNRQPATETHRSGRARRDSSTHSVGCFADPPENFPEYALDAFRTPKRRLLMLFLLFRWIGEDLFFAPESTDQCRLVITIMNNVPGAVGEAATCPACHSKWSEQSLFGGLEYRCLNCGAMFDEYGSRIAVSSE